MKHDLFLLNRVWHQGVNVSVHNGDKWMRKARVGDLVTIKETGIDRMLISGKIIGMALIPFALIPEEWLEHEHDPACTNRAGLRQAMLANYKYYLGGADLVTVLIFEI